jgi:hypothetical protein
MSKNLSPAAKLVGSAVDKLHKDSLVSRVVLSDKKINKTVICYHGNCGDNAIIAVLKDYTE